MRKTILALATAGAFVGTPLPTLAQPYGDSDNYDYRPYRYHSSDHDRPYDRRVSRARTSLVVALAPPSSP